MAQELTGDALAAALKKINPGGTYASQAAILTASPAPTTKTVVSSGGTINQVNPNGTYSSGSAITSPTSTRSFSTGDTSPEAIASRGTTTPVATTSSTVRTDLQTAADTGITLPIKKDTSWSDYQAKIQPSLTQPTTPNYVDKYTQLRRDQGITALEDTIGANEAEKAELLANLMKFKRNEMSGQPLGFAQGRISVEQQGIQDQLDFIDRQENIVIAKLNTKNKFIENIMNLTKDDFATANDAYNTEFNRNLSIQSQINTEKNQIRDDARATLTTINNMVSNSGKSYTELDPIMKANINALELQADMPVGTFETFATSKPKANIISTTTGSDANGNDYVYFISKDPITGALTTDAIATGGVSKPPTIAADTMTETERKAFINSQIGSEGFKTATDDEKSSFIRSLGGNPYDYQPY